MNNVNEETKRRWAPWWVYAIVIVAANLARTVYLVPDGMALWLQILIGVASILLVAALVTVIYRAARR